MSEILEGAITPEGKAHYLTQADLDANPGEEIGKVGDLIYYPEVNSEAPGDSLEDGPKEDVEPIKEPVKTQAMLDFDRRIGYCEKMLEVLSDTDCTLEDLELLPNFIQNFCQNLIIAQSENKKAISELEVKMYAEKFGDLYEKQASQDSVQETV